jgi:hypothetical protein
MQKDDILTFLAEGEKSYADFRVKGHYPKKELRLLAEAKVVEKWIKGRKIIWRLASAEKAELDLISEGLDIAIKLIEEVGDISSTLVDTKPKEMIKDVAEDLMTEPFLKKEEKDSFVGIPRLAADSPNVVFDTKPELVKPIIPAPIEAPTVLEQIVVQAVGKDVLLGNDGVKIGEVTSAKVVGKEIIAEILIQNNSGVTIDKGTMVSVDIPKSAEIVTLPNEEKKHFWQR